VIDLTGRRVLVTGGGRGIGAACCRLFARAGAAVALNYRAAAARAEAVLAELRQISTREHFAFRADVSEPAAVDALFAAVEERWGGLDCLVNNAAVWWRNPVETLDLERLERTWAINVTAPFLCARAAVPFLREGADGNIVNLTSTAGQRGEAWYSPYAASKGALIAATKSWSTELAPAVRVNSVAPGWVDTEMNVEPFAAGGREALAAAIPLGRIATAEDIAGPVVFLASPLARHITGETLSVNGGSVLAG
jgi:3-oxoacyl-[acyl-carrier protein] reductase